MKNILITGVATGIGFTTAQQFIDQGYFVYGSVRKQTDAQRLKAQFGERFYPLIFDVCDEVAIGEAAEELAQHIGEEGLEALVNNAGMVVSGPIQLVDINELEYQLNVNVLGVVRVTQAFLPFLGASLPKRNKPGKIFNISSVSGVFAAPFLGPYCASKYALEAINDSLRRELLIYGIDVVCIEPGPIRTPIWKKALEQSKTYPDSDYAPLLKSTNKMIQKSEANSIPPEQVALTIYNALQRSNPKLRYIVHANKWSFWLMTKLIPDRVIDFFIRRAFNKRMSRKG